jgi:hypothetical protein
LGVFCHELKLGDGNGTLGDSNDAFGTPMVVAASEPLTDSRKTIPTIAEFSALLIGSGEKLAAIP